MQKLIISRLGQKVWEGPADSEPIIVVNAINDLLMHQGVPGGLPEDEWESLMRDIEEFQAKADALGLTDSAPRAIPPETEECAGCPFQDICAELAAIEKLVDDEKSNKGTPATEGDQDPLIEALSETNDELVETVGNLREEVKTLRKDARKIEARLNHTKSLLKQVIDSL